MKEKDIASPTDARLYERARQILVVLVGEAGVKLCQNYVRFGARVAMPSNG